MHPQHKLYTPNLLIHAKTPHHHHALDNPTVCAQRSNPLCGDRIEVFADIDGDGATRHLVDISFLARGCAVCIASASLMTQVIEAKSVQEAKNMAHDAIAWLQDKQREMPHEHLCDLEPVRIYRARHKCATLPWETLLAALAVLDDQKNDDQKNDALT